MLPQDTTPDFFHISIPSTIYLNKDLTFFERFMLADIGSFLRDGGKCFASNNHWAQRFDMSPSRVSETITSLEKHGYISTSAERQGKKVIRRHISLTKKGAELWMPPYEGDDRQTDDDIRKSESSYSKKPEDKDSNTKDTNEDSTRKDIDDQLFEEIWKAYPHWQNRKNKKLARERFGKLSIKRKDVFLKAVKLYEDSLAERDLQFVPGLENWISKGTCDVWLQQALSAPSEKSAEEVRKGKIRLFIVTQQWNHKDGAFPSDAEIAAAEAEART